MRLIAHLSDLHFGTEVPDILDALTHDLRKAKPHVILVTGDITQRARLYQFARAAEFLNQFQVPTLVIPGNHDLPLFNLYHRLIKPLAAFHAYFPTQAESFFLDPELAILGISSARMLRIRRGQLSRRQMAHIERFFSTGQNGRFRIFMSHHPFMPAPRHFPRDLVMGRDRAMRVLGDYGVHLVLGGHSHRLFVANLQEKYTFLHHPMVMAQAGTALSSRNFGRPQSYNLILVKRHRFAIETRVYRDGGFSAQSLHEYPRTNVSQLTPHSVP